MTIKNHYEKVEQTKAREDQKKRYIKRIQDAKEADKTVEEYFKLGDEDAPSDPVR